MIRDANAWLFLVYTNERNFFFSIPFTLLPPEIEPPKEEPSVLVPKGTTRFSRWWELLMDKHKRHESLIHNPKFRIYEFRKIMVWLLWVKERLIWLWLFFILSPLDNVNAQKAGLASRVKHAILYSTSARIGWYLFCAAFIVHFLTYLCHKSHLRRCLSYPRSYGDLGMMHTFEYVVSRFSVVNFVLNIPPWFTPATLASAIFGTLGNLIFTILLIIIFTVAHPIDKAFGCYPSNTPMSQLNDGLCPAYYDNPERGYSTVCTLPRARCGFEETRWQSYLHSIQPFFITMFSVLFGIYMITVNAELRFYMYAHDSVNALIIKDE